MVKPVEGDNTGRDADKKEQKPDNDANARPNRGPLGARIAPGELAPSPVGTVLSFDKKGQEDRGDRVLRRFGKRFAEFGPSQGNDIFKGGTPPQYCKDGANPFLGDRRPPEDDDDITRALQQVRLGPK